MQPSARPVYPRLHRLSLLLEAAQHLLKRPSLLYACCAFPSAGCARKAAPRSACSRTPLLSVTRAYAAAICGAASCLLRLCVSACCARQAAPLHACREAPHVRVHCIEAAADQLPLPLQLLQLAGSLRPSASNQCFLAPVGIFRYLCCRPPCQPTNMTARRPTKTPAHTTANNC